MALLTLCLRRRNVSQYVLLSTLGLDSSRSSSTLTHSVRPLWPRRSTPSSSTRLGSSWRTKQRSSPQLSSSLRLAIFNAILLAAALSSLSLRIPTTQVDIVFSLSYLRAHVVSHDIGMMAAAYVAGLQSKGVAATIKHFTANDQEHERTAAESVMSDRALREIYLYPYALI